MFAIHTICATDGYIRIKSNRARPKQQERMTLFEVLKLNSEMLKRMHRFGISLDDCENLQLFEDYRDMKQMGVKTLFIVDTLCTKYNKSERSVFRLIKRYRELCQEVTV